MQVLPVLASAVVLRAGGDLTDKVFGAPERFVNPISVTFQGNHRDIEPHPGLERHRWVQHAGLFAMLAIDIHEVTGIADLKPKTPGDPLVHIHLAPVRCLVIGR